MILHLPNAYPRPIYYRFAHRDHFLVNKTPGMSYLASTLSKAGISVWASQKENTSLGPVMRSYKDV